jgi:3-phenylpropionate/trans-cinnamate dioxygenase ferredoxin reductase component
MSTNNAYVIVGASLAGAKAAETLRQEGFGGPVVLIGEETERPYERPPLSKDYLLGKAERESVYVHPASWYADNGVELRLGVPVTGIDPVAREVTLADGNRSGYAKLLLATGSSPRRLQVPGTDADGVLYLRRVGDSDRIKEAFAAASRVAVIGAGWIGLETAAAARAAGAEVAILETAALPLLRVLGPEAAEAFAGLHRQNGVDLRFSVQVSEITGSAGRVRGVRLADGSHVEADAVIVGVGITPNTQLAEAAGLAVSNGVVVDARLRSSDPDIYAAGDVASAYHPVLGKHIRVEHWANALNQPQTAARAMLGQDVAYDRVPYFYTDQYDLGMEYAGYVEPGGYDQVVFRGDVERREFVAFWLDGGRVLAGMNVNVWDVNDAIQALVRGGQPVDTGRLADPSVPLDQVVALPARELAAHQAPEPQDFGVPRVEHRLDDVHRGMDGGLQIAGNAVAQETAAQRPPEPLGGDRQQIGRLFTWIIGTRLARIRPPAARGRPRAATARGGGRGGGWGDYVRAIRYREQRRHRRRLRLSLGGAPPLW